MSRHYHPNLKDSEPNPMTRSWRSLVQQGRLTTGWLVLNMKAAMEWCLRSGAGPTAATAFHARNPFPVIPTLEEIEAELGPDRPRPPDSDPFPGSVDRYWAQVEEQSPAMNRPPS